MGKESFIIYASFYKPISKLSDKQLGRLFRAIFRYHIDGDVAVEEDIEMAFAFFVNQFEIDESKYQSKVERNRDNGRKGGAPKGNRNAAKNSSETTQCNPSVEKTSENNPIQAKTSETTLNDNDNVNDNELSSTTARARARDAAEGITGNFLDDLFRDTAAVEAFCMNNRISPEQFRRLAEEVVTEWQLTGQKHTDGTDARRHLINQTRKKIHSNDTQPQDRYAKRRGVDSAARGPEDYTGEV